MGKRGPKSSAELSVVSINTKQLRPEPPEELNPEQAEEWRAIVKGMPSDWFSRETWPLLESYCRHVVTARKVAEQIDHLSEEPTVPTDLMEKLLKMQQRESAAIANLGTKMRLTQQSRYNAKSADTARRNGNHTRLWDDPGDPASEFLD